MVDSPKPANFLTSNRFVWTNEKDADAELIEPQLYVSTNKNWLMFGSRADRPPQSHTITLTNHGKMSVAFKILCSDNYAYFVSKKSGVILAHELNALPHIRCKNSVDIEVYRRPYKCYCSSTKAYNKDEHCKTAHKERLFILLAPLIGAETPPMTLFTNGSASEQLRICLEYIPKTSVAERGEFYLKKYRLGWNTWCKDAKALMKKYRDDYEKHLKKQLENESATRRRHAKAKSSGFPEEYSAVEPSDATQYSTKEAQVDEKKQKEESHPEVKPRQLRSTKRFTRSAPRKRWVGATASRTPSRSGKVRMAKRQKPVDSDGVNTESRKRKQKATPTANTQTNEQTPVKTDPQTMTPEKTKERKTDSKGSRKRGSAKIKSKPKQAATIPTVTPTTTAQEKTPAKVRTQPTQPSTKQ